MAVCPNCGHDNTEGAKFCSECGTRLGVPAAPAREVRKTVTVVFCDVTGSTALGERLDPESLRSVMARYFERMQGVLESHGGTVEKFIGDAVMAVFGIPVLHEDDAIRAVRAADEMRSALAELNTDLEREWSVTLRTRIGVHTGPVVAGDPSAGQMLVTGDAVNTAARLEQAAEPGEILIGEDTFALTLDAIEAEPVDPLALKGKAETVGAYRLLSVRAGVPGHERGLDSPMIGRERPLRMLFDAFEGSVADAACHLFTVLGPAGIGKSRLVREFISTLGDRATVLSGRCLSYGEGITFWPVAEMAIQAAGIGEDDPPDRARSAIRELLDGESDADIVAEHVAGLLGLDGSGPVEPLWAVRRLLETVGRRSPVVAVFDDIHWAEPTMLDVIEHVAEWSRDVPILLLCMARPELLEDRPAWGGGKRNATSAHLEPLSEPEADALIENLLGHPALTPEIRERIRAAAQGNPLFVEEMLSMLLDDGVLVQKDGEWVTTVDLTTVQVPPAISALLASRLDRLSGEERTVLEAASIVGEVFDRATVGALVSDAIGTRLDHHLGTLLRKDVIRASPSDIGGSEGLRFRHILLRDAAYEAVPKAERAELHEAFADHLGASLGDRASEFDEFIGYHLEQAHRMRDELGLRDEQTSSTAAAASEHLSAAGRRAFQRGDMLTASNLLGRASNLLDPDDPARFRMAWELGYALAESGSLRESATLLEDAIARAQSSGDEVSAGYATCVWWLYQVIGNPETNIDEWDAVSERLVGFFDGVGDVRGSALARTQLAYSLWFREQIEASRIAAERALEDARASGDRLLESDLLGHLLACRALGPTPVSEATAAAEETLAAARARGDRRLEQSALRNIGNLHMLAGEFDEARRVISEGRAILQELGASIEYWATAQNVGRVEWLAGDLDAAAEVLAEACGALEALGETAFLSTNATLLAGIEIERGNAAEGQRWIEVAERTGSPDDRATQIGIELARGQLLAIPDRAAAEDHLRRAVELVDETGILSWSADIRLEFARMLGSDRIEEATALAREGLEFAERKEAGGIAAKIRAFLAELEG